MAKLEKKGKVGTLSGKIGDVVVSNWNEIDYVRDVPKKSKKEASPAQQDHRKRFGVVNSFLSKFSQYITIGFKDYAIRKTALNAASTINFPSLTTGSFPDYSIDVTKLQLSKGLLGKPTNATVRSDEAGIVVIEWKSDGSRSYAKPDDELLVCVIEDITKDVEIDIRVAKRSDGSYAMEIGDEYSGETVHVFISFVSKDSMFVSDSVYIGTVTVA